jgi:hypothetical protein
MSIKTFTVIAAVIAGTITVGDRANAQIITGGYSTSPGVVTTSYYTPALNSYYTTPAYYSTPYMSGYYTSGYYARPYLFAGSYATPYYTSYYAEPYYGTGFYVGGPRLGLGWRRW